MILFGCLLAFSAAVAPRLVLILAWIFGSRWDAVWDGNILLPILGIVSGTGCGSSWVCSWTS